VTLVDTGYRDLTSRVLGLMEVYVSLVILDDCGCPWEPVKYLL